MSKHLLIVDDDSHMRSILKESFASNGYDIKVAKEGQSALKVLDLEQINLVVTDLMMPKMDGMELMRAAIKKHPDVGFLFITAYGTIETAVEALKTGAFDFISKPFSISQLETRVDRFFEYEHLKSENKELRKKLSTSQRFDRIVGQSDTMLKVLQQIDIVAKSDAPVFIQAESGTGKELIARSIHENSNRLEKPFVTVNCSAIPESLVESTLFGHEKGAFTNAVKAHWGLFEEAHEGTLLLDEISDMPVNLQAKLLRVLQENTLTRVGSAKEIKIDVRVITTTNRNIDDMIQDETFRSDLYYRLNVFPIHLPPVRARRDDIPRLLKHFIEKFRTKYNSDTKKVDEQTMDMLMDYDWPGNVREIENLVERAILYSGDEHLLKKEHFSLRPIRTHQVTNESDIQEFTSIEEMEKSLIYKTLEKTGYNRTKAADILGITTRTLRNKLNQYEADQQQSSA